MAKRTGAYVIELEKSPSVISSASVVGKTESEGPLKNEFDICFSDDKINMDTWESAESALINMAVKKAISKANMTKEQIDVVFAGDLLNQCTASTYGLRELEIPYAGLFGACSTMAFSVAMAATLLDSGAIRYAVAGTSSHFCSAEKQFRYPLEYGGQRSPSAQRTVTGAGAFVIGQNCSEIKINRVMIGKIVDFGVTDTSNMGAAMAPAAADAINNYLKDTATKPEDYSLILTGDLGNIGSELLLELFKSEYDMDISSVHNDCGKMIYYTEKQDVHSGGSGCGCSAVVLASYIMRQMREKKLSRVLFVGTGALMSPLISLEGESIPGIAHVVEFTA